MNNMRTAIWCFGALLAIAFLLSPVRAQSDTAVKNVRNARVSAIEAGMPSITFDKWFRGLAPNMKVRYTKEDCGGTCVKVVATSLDLSFHVVLAMKDSAPKFISARVDEEGEEHTDITSLAALEKDLHTILGK